MDNPLYELGQEVPLVLDLGAAVARPLPPAQPLSVSRPAPSPLPAAPPSVRHPGPRTAPPPAPTPLTLADTRLRLYIDRRLIHPLYHGYQRLCGLIDRLPPCPPNQPDIVFCQPDAALLCDVEALRGFPDRAEDPAAFLRTHLHRWNAPGSRYNGAMPVLVLADGTTTVHLDLGAGRLSSDGGRTWRLTEPWLRMYKTYLVVSLLDAGNHV